MNEMSKAYKKWMVSLPRLVKEFSENVSELDTVLAKAVGVGARLPLLTDANLGVLAQIPHSKRLLRAAHMEQLKLVERVLKFNVRALGDVVEELGTAYAAATDYFDGHHRGMPSTQLCAGGKKEASVAAVMEWIEYIYRAHFIEHIRIQSVARVFREALQTPRGQSEGEEGVGVALKSLLLRFRESDVDRNKVRLILLGCGK
jgi:hypothetical protein